VVGPQRVGRTGMRLFLRLPRRYGVNGLWGLTAPCLYSRTDDVSLTIFNGELPRGVAQASQVSELLIGKRHLHKCVASSLTVEIASAGLAPILRYSFQRRS